MFLLFSCHRRREENTRPEIDLKNKYSKNELDTGELKNLETEEINFDGLYHLPNTELIKVNQIETSFFIQEIFPNYSKSLLIPVKYIDTTTYAQFLISDSATVINQLKKYYLASLIKGEKEIIFKNLYLRKEEDKIFLAMASDNKKYFLEQMFLNLRANIGDIDTLPFGFGKAEAYVFKYINISNKKNDETYEISLIDCFPYSTFPCPTINLIFSKKIGLKEIIYNEKGKKRRSWEPKPIH